MTNKKLKFAAMSVALTACVAAQPMAAHAVEGPDAAADDNAAPQLMPVDDSAPADAPIEDAPVEGVVDGEEEQQEEFTPPVNDEAVATDRLPAFGPGTSTDDITIDYKPAEKPEEPGESGEDGETDGSEGSGETDETENPDGTYVKGDVIDNSKKDEATGEDGKIGEATKEETPDSSSSTTVVDPDAEVKKGESVVGKDEDGNTTITTPTETTGTETTTTTGTGKADSSTTITNTKKGEEIDLDDELGKDVRPDWGTGKDAKLGDYTVDKVETAEDGNSKELTLKKTEEDSKEMSAEDIAKLLDASEDGLEKTEERDKEGHIKTTYTLKKTETSTDENGNTVTRTTYYEITGNSVKTTTETTLVLKVEKGTAEGREDLTTKIELPSITAKNDDGSTFEISSEKLDEMLKNAQNGVYTETVDGKEYTYVIKVSPTESSSLSNAQLAERLGDGFTADDNGVYYKGEKLNFDQMEAVRKTLSYTVTVTETTKNPGQIDDDSAKTDAENEAKLAAIKGALRNAVTEANIDTSNSTFEAELAKITSTEGGTFEFTDANGHKFTFNYNGASVSAPVAGESDPSKNTDTREDVKNNTVTGTAYVTGGSESWSSTTTITGSGSILGSDYTKLPEGLADAQVERDDKGRITKITNGNEVYTFTYTDNAVLTTDQLQKLREEAEKNGWAFDEDAIQKNLTAVSWSKTTTTISTEEKSDSTQTGSVAEKDNTIVEVKATDKDGKESISYTITVDGKKYEGFTKSADGMTYTKTEGKKTTTITVTNDTLLDEDVKELLAKKYSVSKGSITLNKDGTASWETSDNTTVKVRYTDITQKLTVTETTTDNVNKTDLNDLIAAVQDKVNKLEKGDKLTLKGKQTYTIIMDDTGNLSMKDDLGQVVEGTANVNKKLTEVITTIATNYIDYGSLKPEDIWNLLDQQQVYGDGKENKYSGKDGCDSYWPEEKYENNDGMWSNGQWVAKRDEQGNIIGETPIQPTTNFDHLGLDADVKIETEDGGIIDGLLLSDGLTFTYGRKEQIAGYVDLDKYPDKSWNGREYYTSEAEKEAAHATTGALDAKLNTQVQQVNGQVWNGSNYDNTQKLTYTFLDDQNTNAFSGKRFYKVTGQVAYNKVNEFTSEKDAIDLVANLQTMQDKKDAQYVAVKLQDGSTVYYVYSDVTNIEAIGYMTASANTAANQNRGNWLPGHGQTYNGFSNAGDYELRIQGLKLVNGKVQGNYGIDYSLGMELIQNKGSESNGSLNVSDYTTKTIKTTVDTANGSDQYGSYTVDYTKDLNGAEGTGFGHYTTFTEVLKKIFTGSGSKEHDEGSVSYTHRTTDYVDTEAVAKTATTTTDAHVDYNFTTIETRTVIVNGEETVIVPPVTPPETPVEDETPDEVVVTPETPELPPVQDATPDDAAPETPVLPSDVVLPAVQDATALPQTGVNWMAALGMAFSGMLLTIAGAFTSLKYKEKH